MQAHYSVISYNTESKLKKIDRYSNRKINKKQTTNKKTSPISQIKAAG